MNVNLNDSKLGHGYKIKKAITISHEFIEICMV